MIQEIVLFGAGGHMGVVLDIARATDVNNVRALVVDEPVSNTAPPQISERELVRSGIKSGTVAIGDNSRRRLVVDGVGASMPDFEFVTLIHPAATIAPDVILGPGSVVMAGAVINPGSRIGSHCIINTAASVDHDCTIADFASIAPGAVLGGNAKVGEAAAVGLGAHVIHGINIGHGTIIGAGSTVVSDIKELVVAMGTPCRITRTRGPDEPYL